MDPEESPPTCNVIEVKVPEGADKASLINLLKEEIDRDTDIIERSEYLIIKVQKFRPSPYSE
jgi:hypothetical protein